MGTLDTLGRGFATGFGGTFSELMMDELSGKADARREKSKRDERRLQISEKNLKLSEQRLQLQKLEVDFRVKKSLSDFYKTGSTVELGLIAEMMFPATGDSQKDQENKKAASTWVKFHKDTYKALDQNKREEFAAGVGTYWQKFSEKAPPGAITELNRRIAHDPGTAFTHFQDVHKTIQENAADKIVSGLMQPLLEGAPQGGSGTNVGLQLQKTNSFYDKAKGIRDKLIAHTNPLVKKRGLEALNGVMTETRAREDQVRRKGSDDRQRKLDIAEEAATKLRQAIYKSVLGPPETGGPPTVQPHLVEKAMAKALATGDQEAIDTVAKIAKLITPPKASGSIRMKTQRVIEKTFEDGSGRVLKIYPGSEIALREIKGSGTFIGTFAGKKFVFDSAEVAKMAETDPGEITKSQAGNLSLRLDVANDWQRMMELQIALVRQYTPGTVGVFKRLFDRTVDDLLQVANTVGAQGQVEAAGLASLIATTQSALDAIEIGTFDRVDTDAMALSLSKLSVTSNLVIRDALQEALAIGLAMSRTPKGRIPVEVIKAARKDVNVDKILGGGPSIAIPKLLTLLSNVRAKTRLMKDQLEKKRRGVRIIDKRAPGTEGRKKAPRKIFKLRRDGTVERES